MQWIACDVLGVLGLTIGFTCSYLKWRAVVRDLRQVVDVQRRINNELAREVAVLKAALREGREYLP